MAAPRVVREERAQGGGEDVDGAFFCGGRGGGGLGVGGGGADASGEHGDGVSVREVCVK